jgi:hypothetical protein
MSANPSNCCLSGSHGIELAARQRSIRSDHPQDWLDPAAPLEDRRDLGR